MQTINKKQQKYLEKKKKSYNHTFQKKNAHQMKDKLFEKKRKIIIKEKENI